MIDAKATHEGRWPNTHMAVNRSDPVSAHLPVTVVAITVQEGRQVVSQGDNAEIGPAEWPWASWFATRLSALGALLPQRG